MTPRERADTLLKQWDGKNMWKQEISLDIEQAIIAAVLEEREACAEILELEAKRYEAGQSETERKVEELLLALAIKIRARSNGGEK